MINYLPNNIDYRIVSARAIQHYKDSQAFDLTQLSKNKKHQFSKTAKEILLLKYDMWFTWLCKIEYQLRKLENYNRETREMVMKSSDIVTFEYKTIIKHNKDIFDKKFSEAWFKQHDLVYELMKKLIVDYEADSTSSLFTKIAEVLVKIMKATLHEIYELDIVMYEKKDIFVSITDICFDYIEAFPNKCLLTERIKNYEEIKDCKVEEIVIKNYTDGDISKMLNFIELNGIKIKEVI